jgi:hypothetical protein
VQAIAALVPGRTGQQCCMRWHGALVSNIEPSAARKGKWTVDEDIKIKDAIQAHGDEDYVVISALGVPGRTKTKQCNSRWRGVLHPSIDLTAGRTGEWSEDEDSRLQDVAQTHGDKEWAALSSLVPGRTKRQCKGRWDDILDPFIDRANGRKGK